MRDALRFVDDPVEIVQIVKDRVATFEAEAHRVLGRHDAATRSRVITVDQARRNLDGLSFHQHELLAEALDCIAYELFRAAHVSAWHAFMDLLQEKLASDGLVKVKAAHPKWSRFATIDELREEIAEHQLVQVAKDVGLISKGEMKTLHGMLSTRNECAHPSNYRPGANEALGYVSNLLNRMGRLQSKGL